MKLFGNICTVAARCRIRWGLSSLFPAGIPECLSSLPSQARAPQSAKLTVASSGHLSFRKKTFIWPFSLSSSEVELMI